MKLFLLSDLDEILTAYCLSPESQIALGFILKTQAQADLLDSEVNPSL